MRGLRVDSAVRIASVYVVVAGLWMVLSSRLIERLVTDPQHLLEAEVINGLSFVLVTAILLYFERRHANRSSRHLSAIVESTNAAIIGARLDGTITSWNPGATELYGYSAAEARGKSGLMLIPPEREEEFRLILERTSAGTPIKDYETVRLRKDGTRIPVSLIVSPIKSASGAIVGLSAIAHDISDLKRAQRALQMAEVGQLASGLVHEIRNPLNAMRMQIAVIQDSVDSGNEMDLTKNQLQKLENEVLRVRRLANDFLAYGRPARDKPERIEIAPLIAGVTEFVRPDFERSGLQVRTDSTSHPAKLAVFMDRDKLRQVLANLMENGRQAMATGGTLTVGCDQPTHDTVRIWVRDTGCGIHAEKLPRIFDAFYSTKADGTGLGLAVVKKIVETAGGVVLAQSEVDRGTCVEIRLPTADRVPGDGVLRTAAKPNGGWR